MFGLLIGPRKKPPKEHVKDKLNHAIAEGL